MSPAAQSWPVACEEGGDENQEADERDPERHHVEMGEGHVFRAGLDGQKEITEGGEGRGGEHKKDHDGAVHGHQLQVILRRHQIAGCAGLGEQMQAGNR